jgi:uracil-DNA glycosylase
MANEFESDYFKKLTAFLLEERAAGTRYFPPQNEIFAALNHTPFESVKVVLIGQDPYHGIGQANGLCFSVNDGVAFPPSLMNIFKEVKSDIGSPIPLTGNLSAWALQGVLLLNTTLTVAEGKAGSHLNRGWEQFTDAIISKLNGGHKGLVFMLWGANAKAKAKHIDGSKHLILESGHPSPLSANQGKWFGNRHFSRCNAYLNSQGKEPIRW